MHSQLDAMMAESGVARDEANELAAVLSPLVTLSEEAAPTPSAELMHLFAGDGLDGTSLGERRGLPQQTRGHRAKGTLAGVVVLALSGVGATGLSAAANTLPSAWQHEVADFSRHHLPFDFPEPQARSRRPSNQAPDTGLAVRGDALRERRAEPTESTRSAERDGSATKGAPSWHGSGHGSGSATPDHRSAGSTGYSMPRGQYSQAETPVETNSWAEDGPEQGDHDGRSPSSAPDDADGKGKDETGKQYGNNVDHSDQSDRPVKGGSVGGPKGPQKGPVIGPQKGPQKGQPGGGADQGEPGKDKPGDGTGGGSTSPGGPAETEPHDEPGDQGSTGPEGEPVGKDLPPGPVGDSLSG